MMRLILITVVFLSLFFNLFDKSASAEESIASPESSSTPSAVVNSYELFWPLTAGKTEGDSLYFLKLFKEQIRSWFILDDTAKADYAIVLGTKRVLETEKLLKDGKTNLALKALERADSEFSSAYNHIKKADSKGKLAAGGIRRDRLIYIKRLIDYLKTATPEEARPGLDRVKEKADAILRDYLP